MTMTEPTTPSTALTLQTRRNGATFELSDDGLSYECVRVFGAPPDRIFRAFTDPADLTVWFPAGAPAGSELTLCESDAVEGGRYHYRMVIPEYGEMAWHGLYTNIERPCSLSANEWFVMGPGDPDGQPATQTLTFEASGEGQTLMTMHVDLPEPEDPEVFMEQSAAGLSSSLAMLDEHVSA